MLELLDIGADHTALASSTESFPEDRMNDYPTHPEGKHLSVVIREFKKCGNIFSQQNTHAYSNLSAKETNSEKPCIIGKTDITVKGKGVLKLKSARILHESDEKIYVSVATDTNNDHVVDVGLDVPLDLNPTVLNSIPLDPATNFQKILDSLLRENLHPKDKGSILIDQMCPTEVLNVCLFISKNCLKLAATSSRTASEFEAMVRDFPGNDPICYQMSGTAYRLQALSLQLVSQTTTIESMLTDEEAYGTCKKLISVSWEKMLMLRQVLKDLMQTKLQLKALTEVTVTHQSNDNTVQETGQVVLNVGSEKTKVDIKCGTNYFLKYRFTKRYFNLKLTLTLMATILSVGCYVVYYFYHKN